MPTIHSDGTLCLIEDTVDRDQVLRITEYIRFLNEMPRESITAISKIIIDGIKFENSQDLIKILNCFDDVDVAIKRKPTKKADALAKYNIMTNISQSMQRKFGSSIKYLCLSNIDVSTSFMKFLSTSLLNKLFSLELIAIRLNDGPQRHLFKEIENHLVSNQVHLTLMRIKFAHLELNY